MNFHIIDLITYFICFNLNTLIDSWEICRRRFPNCPMEENDSEFFSKDEVFTHCLPAIKENFIF